MGKDEWEVFGREVDTTDPTGYGKFLAMFAILIGGMAVVVGAVGAVAYSLGGNLRQRAGQLLEQEADNASSGGATIEVN